jgi:hypothetical protein
MSHFTQSLWKAFGITHNPLSAYHPQTDRQTEHFNQELEIYLCHFLSWHQEDWNQYIKLA